MAYKSVWLGLIWVSILLNLAAGTLDRLEGVSTVDIYAKSEE